MKKCPVADKQNGQELYIDSGDQVNACNKLYLVFFKQMLIPWML